MLVFTGTDDKCSFPVLAALGLILFQDLQLWTCCFLPCHLPAFPCQQVPTWTTPSLPPKQALIPLLWEVSFPFLQPLLHLFPEKMITVGLKKILQSQNIWSEFILWGRTELDMGQQRALRTLLRWHVKMDFSPFSFCWDFPSSPVAGILYFHCRGYGFDLWSGNYDPTYSTAKGKQTNKQKALVIFREILRCREASISTGIILI